MLRLRAPAAFAVRKVTLAVPLAVSLPTPFRAAASHAARAAEANAAVEAEMASALSGGRTNIPRRIRTLVKGASQQTVRFRHAVTYLMILVQGKLARKEIDPAVVANLVDDVMEECTKAGQGDIAHLLFRAALRFRKQGVKLSAKSLRCLYTAFSHDDAKELMQSLGKELAGEVNAGGSPSLAVTALCYGGLVDEAAAIVAKTSLKSLASQEVSDMVRAYTAKERNDAAEALLNRVLDGDPAEVGHLDRDAIASSIFIGSTATTDAQRVLLKRLIGKGLKLGDDAVCSIAAARLGPASNKKMTVDRVRQIETALQQELGVSQWGLRTTALFLSRTSDAMREELALGDEAVEVKVRQLFFLVETQIANDETDALDRDTLLLLVKGFGSLGKMDMLTATHELLRKVSYIIDNSHYEEMLYWFARHGNVTGALSLNEEMDRDGIRKTARTYKSLAIALRQYYPKITERLYEESRNALGRSDPGLLAQFAHFFAMMGNTERVKDIFGDMQILADRGVRVYTDRIVATMLGALGKDERIFNQLEAMVKRNGMIEVPGVQAKLIEGYAYQGRMGDIEALTRNIVKHDATVYRALLKTYGALRQEDKFEATLNNMRLRGVAFDESTFGIAVSACRAFRDSSKIKRIVESMRGMITTKTARLYVSIASLHTQLGDHDAAQTVWQEMLDAKVPLDMITFNRFLELFVARNNISMIQTVLETMMTHVPPNPVTTTTVVDMLGKMGRFGEMEVLLEEMSNSDSVQPSLVTYHHAMAAYAKIGDVDKMEAIRLKLRNDGLEENHVTYNILIDGYGRAKQYNIMKNVLTERNMRKIPLDDVTFMLLLSAYGRGHMRQEVEDTVAMILDQNTGDRLSPRLLTSIIDAYANLGDSAVLQHYVTLLLNHRMVSRREIDSVFVVYHRLRETTKMDSMLKKYGGTEFTYNITVVAHAKAGSHERVKVLLQEMKKRGMQLHANTAIVVSSVLLKAGNADLAQDVLSWNKKDGAVLSIDDPQQSRPKGDTDDLSSPKDLTDGVLDSIAS